MQAQRASIAPSNHSTPSAASPEGLNHKEHEGINARLMQCGGDTLKGSDPSKQLRSRRGLFVLFVVNVWSGTHRGWLRKRRRGHDSFTGPIARNREAQKEEEEEEGRRKK